MRKMGWTLGFLWAAAGAALAIIPNNGVDAQFAFVGRRQFGSGSFVAVGPNHIMTAQHINMTQFVTLDPLAAKFPIEVDLSSVHDVNNTDIRLYRTITPLPGWYEIDWNPLPVGWTHTEDSNGNLSFSPNGGGIAEELRGVGFGITGTLNANGNGYTADFNSPQHRRQARFFSDSRGNVTLGSRGPFSSLISFLINNGDGTLEAGDSGGGLFRNVGGQWRLVGINSFAGGNRLFGSGFTADRLSAGNPVLHRIAGFAELAPHRAEIQAYLIPEPASMAALGLGLVALLRRRKR
jgi:hypothetical protein